MSKRVDAVEWGSTDVPVAVVAGPYAGSYGRVVGFYRDGAELLAWDVELETGAHAGERVRFEHKADLVWLRYRGEVLGARYFTDTREKPSLVADTLLGAERAAWLAEGATDELWAKALEAATMMAAATQWDRLICLYYLRATLKDPAELMERSIAATDELRALTEH